MRRRWREGPSLVAALTLLVASTTSNDSSLFECPKGSYRFTPPTSERGPVAPVTASVLLLHTIFPPKFHGREQSTLICYFTTSLLHQNYFLESNQKPHYIQRLRQI